MVYELVPVNLSLKGPVVLCLEIDSAHYKIYADGFETNLDRTESGK